MTKAERAALRAKALKWKFVSAIPPKDVLLLLDTLDDAEAVVDAVRCRHGKLCVTAIQALNAYDAKHGDGQ